MKSRTNLNKTEMSKRRSQSTYNLVDRAQVVIQNWNHRSSHVVSMKSVSKANPRVWLSMGWVESCHRNLNSHFKASKPSVLFIPAHQRVGIKFSLNIRICLKFSDRSALKIMKNDDNWTWDLSCANFVKFPRLHIRISMAKSSHHVLRTGKQPLNFNQYHLHTYELRRVC